MRSRKIVAIGVPITLAAAGLALATSAPSQAAAAPSPVPSVLLHQKLSWSECYPGDGYPELKCAAVTTPRDWADPSGPTITIEISRIAASDPAKRRGVLFTNPGGPGAPGLALPLFIPSTDPSISAAYDLIGIDPRGTGASSPTLQCADPNVLSTLDNLDGRDTSTANQRRFLFLDQEYAGQCSRDPLTPVINEDQIARDFDLVRAVLGERKISYLGFSAGTQLGAWYAALFPQHVDRFVLDGNIDFTSLTYKSFNRQPRGFQVNFEKFLEPWIASYDDIYGLGATPQAVNNTYEKRRAALAAKPLTLLDGSKLTASGYDTAISGGLYTTSEYDPIASALAAIEHYSTASTDEKQLVLDYFGSSDVTGSDPFWAIVCQDDAHESYSAIVSETQQFRIKYPLVGADWNAYPCSFFTTPVIGSPIQGSTLPPLLMLNNQYDPATPLANALSARAATPRARLVEVLNQPGHTIYGYGDECADGYANNWLLNGVLPTHDVTCQPIPLPTPAAASASLSNALTKTAPRVTAEEWLKQFYAQHGQPSAAD